MLIIDRFEGEYALIEMNRKVFHIPKSFLPKDAKEGDVITIKVSIDKKATSDLKKDVDDLAEELFKE